MSEAPEMLTPEECAEWLRITLRELADNTRRGKIPCFQITTRIKRYHKPTVLAAMKGKS